MNYIELVEITPKTDIKVIEETLCRIGIANRKDHVLYPSAYLYKKDEKLHIVHFKQLFYLTRKNGYKNISEEDYIRRNAVMFCLKNWGLIDVKDSDIEPHNRTVYVLSHKDKPNWQIEHKFNRNLLK